VDWFPVHQVDIEGLFEDSQIAVVQMTCYLLLFQGFGKPDVGLASEGVSARGGLPLSGSALDVAGTVSVLGGQSKRLVTSRSSMSRNLPFGKRWTRPWSL
jgi:hypothetical protein